MIWWDRFVDDSVDDDSSRARKAFICNTLRLSSGGGTGIRTPERVSPLTVFKTAAFDRSAIPPHDHYPFTGSITSSPPMYPRSASGITTDPSRC